MFTVIYSICIYIYTILLICVTTRTRHCMLHVLPIAFPILILKGLFYFEAKVRSVKANAYDSAYASALSEHAVHGALAGLTCVSVVPYLVRGSWQCGMVGHWMSSVPALHNWHFHLMSLSSHLQPP